jgi:hypothetical protein
MGSQGKMEAVISAITFTQAQSKETIAKHVEGILVHIDQRTGSPSEELLSEIQG